MRKKIIIGSVLVALLMLVSSQLCFVQNARAWPTSWHTGNANVGSMWISELNISSEGYDTDTIGIAHASATDDWVYWSSGSGNVVANWDAYLDSTHPSYYVKFCLSIYTIDPITAVGKGNIERTYNADTAYDQGGSITVSVSMAAGKKAICYLNAWIEVRNTDDVKNFSSIAEDRSVLLNSNAFLNFATAVAQTNQAWPPMWSWMRGWENHFDTEEQMFNEQTYFRVGNQEVELEGTINGVWDLGTFVADPYYGTMDFIFNGEYTKNWRINYGNWIVGPVKIDYDIEAMPWPRINPIYIWNYQLWHDSDFVAYHTGLWLWPRPAEGSSLGLASAYRDWQDLFGNIHCDFYFDASQSGGAHIYEYDETNYKIHIAQNGDNSLPTEDINVYWEEDCSYEYSVEPTVTNATYFGVTYVDIDISSALAGENQFIYTYKPDAGTTQIAIEV